MLRVFNLCVTPDDHEAFSKMLATFAVEQAKVQLGILKVISADENLPEQSAAAIQSLIAHQESEIERYEFFLSRL